MKKGDFFDHRGSPIVYLNDSEYIGGGDAFGKWALINFHYQDACNMKYYEDLAMNSIRHKVNTTHGRRYIEVHFNCGG